MLLPLQEIKAIKVQQKATARLVADLQRNVSSAAAAAATEVAALRQRLQALETAGAVSSGPPPPADATAAALSGRLANLTAQVSSSEHSNRHRVSELLPNPVQCRCLPTSRGRRRGVGRSRPRASEQFQHAARVAAQVDMMWEGLRAAERREMGLLGLLAGLAALVVPPRMGQGRFSTALRATLLLLAAANSLVGLANYAHAYLAGGVRLFSSGLEQPELQLLT